MRSFQVRGSCAIFFAQLGVPTNALLASSFAPGGCRRPLKLIELWRYLPVSRKFRALAARWDRERSLGSCGGPREQGRSGRVETRAAHAGARS